MMRLPRILVALIYCYGTLSKLHADDSKEIVNQGQKQEEDSNLALDAQANVIFKIVSHGSDDYYKGLCLRDEILLKPLGLVLKNEEVEADKNRIHIGGFLEENLCVTAVLIPEETSLKMQRIAVANHQQNQGLGSALLIFCEQYALDRGYTSIYCIAREPAIPFYLKNHYEIKGIPFISRGLVHCIMCKQL